MWYSALHIFMMLNEIMMAKQIELLKDACALHTTCHRTGNPTIDTCFDSDRLDLPRVSILPDPERMATKEGAEKARLGLK